MDYRNSNETENEDNLNDNFLIEEYLNNIKIKDPIYSILVIIYTILICTGITGNFLVLLAVINQPAMRNLRNMFIVNLAISDLLLCILTMPLTLIQIVTKHWPLGRFGLWCKLTQTSQTVSVFVSTISILAIALDRYQVIRYPTRGNQHLYAVITLSFVWLLAILFASPIFMFTELIEHQIPLPNIQVVLFCAEEWPIDNGPLYYSIFSIAFQYIVPLTLVSIIHAIIHFRLKTRVIRSISCSEQRRFDRENRLRRINHMLMFIAIAFGVSWLPLNLFNLYVDYYLVNDRRAIIVFAFCHIIAMTSACTNFMIYGFLNKNFRKEFASILMDNIKQRASAVQDIKSIINTEYTHKQCNTTVMTVLDCRENLLNKTLN